MNAVAPLIPCIVSGGSGTRLWPVSRESMPKPFMRLADDQSLLQKTFLRIAGLPDVARLLTVTNRDLLFRTLDDYRAVNRSGLAQDLLLEPMGRNTAPAIAAAALHVQEHFGDQAQLLILPADHLIRDEQAFAAAVAEARGLAAQGYLVTFGITPERAETGFGYIERGPYYAVQVEPGCFGTFAGLKTDAQARVLDGGGQPIPGLYAAGADMASLFAGHYPSGGINLGPALTFGYIAGRHIAGALGYEQEQAQRG